MVISNLDILNELQELLRSGDVISTTKRGVTTTSENFSGNGSQVTFTVTNTPLRNIRSVTVDSNPQTKFVDYTIDWDNNQITFTVAPSTGTDNITIQYDYGSTVFGSKITGDKIYSDFPREDLTLESYPRIGFDIISSITSPKALQGKVLQTNILFSFIVYATTKNEMETIIKNVRSLIDSNKRNLIYLNFIKVTGSGPINTIENKHGKVVSRNIDFNSPFEFEIET